MSDRLKPNKTTFETTTRRTVLILFVASLSLGMLTGGMVFYRLSYLWGLIFMVSWVGLSSASRGLNLRRTIRASRAQVGQVFEEQYDIQNNSYFPIFWLELQDESPLPGSQSLYVLNLLKGKNARSFLLRTRLNKRGVYQIGPISLAYGDIFGLYRGCQTIASRSTLVVYPPIFHIGDFPYPPGILSGGEASRRRTHQITPNAAGVREYAPGDPLSRIHWLSSVRRNQLMVKEFELDPSADVWFFIDTESKAHTEIPWQGLDEVDQNFWDWLPFLEIPAFSVPYVTNELRGAPNVSILSPSTVEYSISISASLAHYFLRHRRSVGLVSFAHNLTIIPPDRSGRQSGKILEALALLKTDGEIPLVNWAETQARHLSRGSIVIIITPSVQHEISYLADRLYHLGLRPVLVLLNAASFGGSVGSESIYENIKVMGYPVYIVANGDNISSVFSMPLDKKYLGD
jgi:uncharacterized protein (DUF58 family)